MVRPDKQDIDLPNRAIGTLGKALEIVVAKILSDYIKSHGLLPNQQIGARKGRLTETALEKLVDGVYTVQGYGKKYVTSLLSLNVIRAFDKVNYQRLLYNLKKKGILFFLVEQIKNFLSNRATSISLGQKTSLIKPAITGIPQGSFISLILFLFFNGPLIKKLTKLKQKVQVRGFINDVYLLAYNIFIYTNYLELKRAYEVYFQ